MTENVDIEIKYKYICDKCEFKCNIISRWELHIKTEKHKTGHRKIRSDYKEPYKCEKCEYKTKNKLMLLQIEEREKEFNYYCKKCDYGTISKDLYEKHINTEEHKKYDIRHK